MSKGARLAVFLVLAGALGRLQAAEAGYAVVKGWPLPHGNILGYNLYASAKAAGEFRKVNAQPITGSAYVLTGLSPGWRYYFELTQVTTSQPPVESRPSQPFSMLALAGTGAPGAPPPAMHGLDFEDAGAFQMNYLTTNRASKMTLSLDRQIKHGGNCSLKIESAVRAGSETTAMLLGNPAVDCPFQAAHTGNLTLWIYSEKRFDIGLAFREAKTHGADGVSWAGPFRTTPGGSTWSKMVFPLGQFTRLMERRNGIETTNFFGNGQMHLDCLVELMISAKAGNFLFYVDDINFE